MKFKTIGERITYARGLKGWKKIQLAHAVGVSAAAVTQWEQGDTKGLKPENLVAVAHALDVLTDWLAVELGPMKEEKTPAERVLLENYRATPPALRPAVLKAAQGIREACGTYSTALEEA